jgi:Flp pilus assembly protein TadD
MAGQAETEAPPAVKSTAEDHNQRGVELYENERYDEAVDQFKKALALDPGNSLYHCNLAVAYGERGDVSEAFSEYQRALSLNPADLTSLLNLGYAYEQQGETEKARREWQKLVDAAPLSAEADEARENLTSLEP